MVHYANTMDLLEYRQILAAEKKRKGKSKNKFNAQGQRVNGHWMDSGDEAKRYNDLVLMQRAGQISELQVHPRIPIEIGGVPILFDSGKQMEYEADFVYRRSDGVRVIEDVKGYRTREYKIKKALLRAMGLEISEVEKRRLPVNAGSGDGEKPRKRGRSVRRRGTS